MDVFTRRDQDIDIQKKDRVTTLREDGHIHAEERASEETNAANTLISDFQLPEL